MKRWQLALAVMTVLALLGSVKQASAQYGYSGRSSSGYVNRFSSPRLSPWLNFFRNDPGPVDNYNRFVRRDIQLRNTLRQQQIGLQQQRSAINLLGNQFQRAQQNSTVSPTGTGSVFMNYMHYYPMASPGGRGR